MNWARILKSAVIFGALAGVGSAGYLTRERWLPLVSKAEPSEEPTDDAASETPTNKIIVSEQAQKNLGLRAKVLTPQGFWKTLQVPGMVVDRPGQSDRGIVAPATGVVTKIRAFPGDTVAAGAPLFTIKLLSESLHLTQTELFKATQDITLAESQRTRLTAVEGAVPESRVIEVESQIRRLRVAVQAYRQELLNRGFQPTMIDEAATGKFVNELSVFAPTSTAPTPNTLAEGPTVSTELEVQELKVDLGQQVQAGQMLCMLANHTNLAVEGYAFRDEIPLLEHCVRQNWPIEVDFQDSSSEWGGVRQEFRVGYLSNTIDPQTRTFSFRMPLENQSKSITHTGQSQTLWRFRPGQRVRLLLRTEELTNVVVVPADAVARDGPDAFVFTQNDNTFTRWPVQIVHQERSVVVCANDGSFPLGKFVVQSGGTQLNRIVKGSSNGGAPKGYHMHADGSVHKNSDTDEK